MSRPAAPSPLRHALVLGGLLATGLLLTVLVWRLAEHDQQRNTLAEFERRAGDQAHLARQRLALYEHMVNYLAIFFVSQRNVSPQEFGRAAQELLQRHAAVQALQWVQRVPGTERAAFERTATAALGRPFLITTRDPAGRFVSAPERDEYLPIYYCEPLAGNEPVVGYDVTHAPPAATLARARARAGGRLAVSPQFRLAQTDAQDPELGVVFALPVFTDAGERGAAPSFRGFVQGVFRVETMLGRTHLARPDGALRIYYFDDSAGPGEENLLYANEAGREPLRETGRGNFHPATDPQPGDFTAILGIGDRRWRLLIKPDAAWLAGQQAAAPGLLFGGGLLITLLVTLLVHTLLRRNEHIGREVAERTAELLTARRLLEDDIRQREDTELRLRESEARLQAILDHSPGPIFVKDPAGRHLLFSHSFAAFCRRPVEEIVGRTDFELFPEDQARAFRANDEEVLRSGEPRASEETASTPGGPRTSIVQRFPLRDASGRIYAIGGIVTDITERVRTEGERREMERRLQTSQKLESLGVLAGGIAHDFNNILTAVLGNASLARQIGGPDSPVQRQLTSIEHAARRAADLCQQMLAYAGKGRIVTDRVDLGEIVRGTATLLEVSISKSIHLDLRLAAALPPVLADVTQLRQIAMNLIINAADAIGDSLERADGRIAVSTFAREVTAAELAAAAGQPELPAGVYVGLEVSDNGCGMAPETVARIFEPFFTTKFSGRGLGLSAVLGIVQSHKGALFVESQRGRGSTFRLLLPAVAGGIERAAPPDPAGAPGRPLRGTVLVVDDEQSVRDVTRASLSGFGLTVLTAASGEEAVALCREQGAGIQLVLLDLTMPGISGEETARRLRLINATQKIVLMSGYSESDATRRIGHLGVAGFLQKPFELDTLLARIRQHLA